MNKINYEASGEVYSGDISERVKRDDTFASFVRESLSKHNTYGLEQDLFFAVYSHPETNEEICIVGNPKIKESIIGVWFPSELFGLSPMGEKIISFGTAKSNKGSGIRVKKDLTKEIHAKLEIHSGNISKRMANDSEFANFVRLSIIRHQNCDWGDSGPEDKIENDKALENGEPVIAIYNYKDDGSESISITTKFVEDGLVTAVVFPSELWEPFAKFETGHTCKTDGISERSFEDQNFKDFITKSFLRYIKCDWGEACDELKIENDDTIKAIESGGVGVSSIDAIFDSAAHPETIGVYIYPETAEEVWIVTSFIKNETTIMFKSEYISEKMSSMKPGEFMLILGGGQE